ncbi:hypothetical protein Bhyg_13548, partial [Pseudolycoriella hygida]
CSTMTGNVENICYRLEDPIEQCVSNQKLDQTFHLERIVVIGQIGSGRKTQAKIFAKRCKLRTPIESENYGVNFIQTYYPTRLHATWMDLGGNCIHSLSPIAVFGPFTQKNYKKYQFKQIRLLRLQEGHKICKIR